MDYVVLKAEHDGRTFKIEEDNPDVGVYLYIYQDGKCIRDYLQDTIDICKETALEEYGVPRTAWRS